MPDQRRAPVGDHDIEADNLRSDPHVFLSYAHQHRSRLVVIDISMPVMNGLEVLRLLRDISPGTRVFTLTSKAFAPLFRVDSQRHVSKNT